MENNTERTVKYLKAQLMQNIYMIGKPNDTAMEKARERWNSLGKPLHSLGLLETAVVRMAGMTGTENVCVDKKAIVVMCADHGVLSEGVTQTDASVTATVARNLTVGCTCVNIMAEQAGADVFPIDMGMLAENIKEDEEDKDLYPMVLCNRRVGSGTGNIVAEPAMTEEACLRAILTGIDIVGELTTQGYQMIGMGEMGIGNTTPSSALVSVLLNLPVEDVTGRGAGLSDLGLEKKKKAVKAAVARYWKATEDVHFEAGPLFEMETAVELLSQLGGYEIAGMVGLCLGAAIYEVPVVLDGFISETAALCASLISSSCVHWLLASHVSAEPAAVKVLQALKLNPVIWAGMCLGEGTGAAVAMPLYEAGLAVYKRMSTFEEIQVERYKNYQSKQ